MNNKMGVPLEGFAEFTRISAAEGAVLLKNEGNTLPIKKDEPVALFGRCQINYYRCGTGSGGAVNVSYVVNIIDGFTNNGINVDKELADIYKDWVKENPFDNGGGGWAAEPWHQKEMPVSDTLAKEVAKRAKKAIMVVGRTAGEDQDNAVKEGSYLFTKEEKDILLTLCANFESVILLLNVPNIVDISFIEEEKYQNIKSVMYIWQGGVEGGNAAADLVNGTVTPSGKLVDTMAYSAEDYPCMPYFGNKDKSLYCDDIYVGYRYFETFCKDKVQFPFGFGLSYTDFEVSFDDLKVDGEGKDAVLTVKATVKNIGTEFAGKEVVQIYSKAPQGKLGKPARELVAFKKTKLLALGECQELTLTFKASELASYDDSGVTGYKSAYVLESGEYEIYAGTSVRNAAKLNTSFIVNDTLVVEQLQEALSPVESFKRIKPGVLKDNGDYEIEYEDVPTRSFSIKERIENNLPETMKITGDKGITLQDVKAGKASLDEFVAQFDEKDLAAIVRGEGMSSPKVTPGTASAFGAVSDKLIKYGLPIACCSDGPSGIRMESGLKATQVPIGTLLASSWNLEHVKELYVLEGKELKRNEVDTLLGPGVNIHRSPINGRNFEYFSEDPLITGYFAKAITEGIREGGCEATVKHFACNSQETYRHFVNAVVSERAVRQIYLKGFEIAVKQGGLRSIMTSYNPINGNWAASNYDLNTTILRDEWGYTGIVMTDWWAKMNDCVLGGEGNTKDTASMVRSQNDLYMVVNNDGAEINANDDNTAEYLAEGKLTVGELQRCAKNICRFLLDCNAFERGPVKLNEVREFKAIADETAELKLDETLRIEPKFNEPVKVEVLNDGVYIVSASIMSELDWIAQSSCNLNLNGEVAITIQTSGTGGQWRAQKLTSIKLYKGVYELNLLVQKEGTNIGYLDFTLVK